jgi:lipopolysaccharide export system permease protein
LYRRIAISTPALELASNSVKRFNDTVLVTGAVSGTSIGDILILDKTETGERRLIMAKEAELKDGGNEGLNLELDNAFIQSSKELARSDYDYAHADFLRYWIPQNDIMQSTTTITSGQMSSVDVLSKIRTREADIQVILNERYSRNLVYALNLELALRKGPMNDAWNRLPNQLTNFTREMLAINTIRNDRNLSLDRLEFYKKFSLPLGALSFVFLAVPLGMLARKRGQALGFFFALLISFLYWALLLLGQSSGIRLNFSPFWSMWLPDILSVAAGSIMLLYRIRR